METIKKNFDFVDTIRCLSMMGIVFEHTEVFGAANYGSFYTSFAQAAVMQFFKFATIAFFLIAGFLINHKFVDYTAVQYLKNRLKSTIGPWAFWLNMFILINVLGLLYVAYFKYNGERHMPSPFMDYLGTEYYNVIFTTSFWFIPNFLICIGILLAFKKYLYSLRFGIILGLASLFYSVNLHYGWIRTQHTTALFGFVFFLWLGALMNRHIDEVFAFIKKTSYIWLIGLTTALFILSNLEIVYLKSVGSEDAYNTLRITNILYSLSFFVILLKVGSINQVNRIFQPRKTTYGIYLLHQIIILKVLSEIFRPFNLQVSTMTLVEAILYSVGRYVLTYFISFVIVNLILKTKLRWSIGS
ncbi:acyltransferase family protein [Pedobacter sp. PWIIR3]